MLSAVQEGARMRERPAIWNMHEWSQLRMLAVGALIALPSIPILMLVALIFLV